jgi:hypothetical protein
MNDVEVGGPRGWATLIEVETRFYSVFVVRVMEHVHCLVCVELLSYA